MLPVEWEVLLVACLTSLACGLTGSISILRRQALLGDALGHSLLAGIGIGFWVLGSSSSPWLFAFAVASGMMAVGLSEWVSRAVGGNQSMALGLVFPAFFSIGVVLISLAPKSAHIDLDRVLTGNMDLAPLERLQWRGMDLGPLSAWTLSCSLILVASFIWLFHRRLIWHLFDPQGAKAAGIVLWPLSLAWLLLSAVTISLAFETMGTVMVVSLLVAPGATAWMLTRSINSYLAVTCLAAIASGVAGRGITMFFDASTTATTASSSIIIFLLAYLLAPGEGIVARWRHGVKARREIEMRLVLVHLWHHELLGDESTECSETTMAQHLGLPAQRIRATLGSLESRKLAYPTDGIWKTTQQGKVEARDQMSGSKASL